METFQRYWPFVWGIHRSPMNSPHKGQWRGALMFSLICALNKQSWGWWFETPSHSLWHHCDVHNSWNIPYAQRRLWKRFRLLRKSTAVRTTKYWHPPNTTITNREFFCNRNWFVVVNLRVWLLCWQTGKVGISKSWLASFWLRKHRCGSDDRLTSCEL